MRLRKACALRAKPEPSSSLLFLPSCARSSGRGSWLEMVFSAVRQWKAPEVGQVTVTAARASGPSQYHTLQFVGASGPVSPPFGFLLLLLTLFRNLLPFETVKSRKTVRTGFASLGPSPPGPQGCRQQARSGRWGRAWPGQCLWGTESGKAGRAGQSLWPHG